MVENAGKLRINRKIKPETIGYFSLFIRKNGVNTGKSGYLWYCILVCKTQCILNEREGICLTRVR